MINNDALPEIDDRPGDARDHRSTATVITPAPAAELPLAQLYSLF